MPVTSDTPAKRSATFDVLICVVMTGSHRPELSVFVQGLLAKAPHVVTVLICAAALDDAEPAAEITAEPKNARQTDTQNGFIHVSSLRLCARVRSDAGGASAADARQSKKVAGGGRKGHFARIR